LLKNLKNTTGDYFFCRTLYIVLYMYIVHRRRALAALCSGAARVLLLRALVQKYVMGPLVPKQLWRSFVFCQFTLWLWWTVLH